MPPISVVAPGQRYGRLVVLGSTEARNSSREIVWLCRCDCGNKSRVSSGNLVRHTRSCGCLGGAVNRTKVCIACGQEKPSTEFHLERGRRRGRCKPCQNTYNREHRIYRAKRSTLRRHVKYLLQSARERAAKKGWDYDLDPSWIRERLERGVCEASGLPFVNDMPLWAPSIDRIDNARGYTQDNCRLVVCAYNQAKGRGTDADVLVLARAVLNVPGSEMHD